MSDANPVINETERATERNWMDAFSRPQAPQTAQSATLTGPSPTARMDAIRAEVDASAEALRASVARLMAEAGSMAAQTAAHGPVPPQEVRHRIADFLADEGLEDPKGITSRLLASVPGEAFGSKETTRRRLAEALARLIVEVRPEYTGAAPSRGILTDPAWVAAFLADALGSLGTLPEWALEKIAGLEQELAELHAAPAPEQPDVSLYLTEIRRQRALLGEVLAMPAVASALTEEQAAELRARANTSRRPSVTYMGGGG